MSRLMVSREWFIRSASCFARREPDRVDEFAAVLVEQGFMTPMEAVRWTAEILTPKGVGEEG